jgi:hypothetical protein
MARIMTREEVGQAYMPLVELYCTLQVKELERKGKLRRNKNNKVVLYL